jgi:hypothetical protein
MKKITRCATFIAIAAASFLAFSCASQPKPSSPEPAPQAAPAPAPKVEEPAPAPKAEIAAPDAERAKASELRKRAFDLGIKDVLPDDYAAAEKDFAAGNDSYGKDNASSAASFGSASEKYAAAIEKGLPLLAVKARENAERMRKAASAKGAADSFAPLWTQAEADYADRQKAEASGEYEKAIAGYVASTRDYDILYKLCGAKSIREYMTARDLPKWASSPWTIAQTKYQASQDLFRSDSKASVDSADEALLRYGIARDTALDFYSSDRKKASESERSRANGIKTEVAVKDEYAAATALYDKAEAARADKDLEGAAGLYDQAAKAFAAAYAHAKQKMDVAQGELDSLDAALATKEAETAAAGGSGR